MPRLIDILSNLGLERLGSIEFFLVTNPTAEFNLNSLSVNFLIKIETMNFQQKLASGNSWSMAEIGYH